jgi:hypothetical protein
MDDLISRKYLYEKLSKMDELTRKNVINTPRNSQQFLMYSLQMNERTAFKHVVADAPEVKNTNTTDQWIPCSERLPDEECQLYWTTHEDGSIVLHSYTKENGFILNWEVDDLELRKKQGQVIAWKKIAVPQPYKKS